MGYYFSILLQHLKLWDFSILAEGRGGFVNSLDICYKIVILLIAIVGILGFFFKGKKHWVFLKELVKKLDIISSKSTALFDKLVPRILQGLEKKGIIEDNSLVEWTEIISSANYTTQSPKYLNETGKKALADCTLQKIIDDNAEKFLTDLDNAKLTTALDVEERSFYVLDSRKEEPIFNSLKNYIYNNPEANVYSCLFVGSIYLRDKYLNKHPEISQD